MNPEIQQLVEKANQQLNNQQFELGYETLKEALIYDEQNTDVLLTLSRLGVQVLYYPQETISYASTLLKTEVGNSEAYAYRGWGYYEIGEFDLALNDLNRSISMTDHSNVYAFGGRGLTYYQMNEMQKAYDDITIALQSNTTWLLGYATRGWILFDLSRYDEAITDFTHAIEEDNTYGYAYGGRGLAFYEKSEYDRAIEDLSIAMKTNEQWALGYAMRGWSYYQIDFYQEQFDLALADFNKAIELSDGNYPYAQAGRGLVNYQMSHFKEALLDLNIGLASNKDWAIGYATRGYTYYELDKYVIALADFNKAIELSHGDYAYAQGGRGLVQYQLEEYEDAIIDLKVVLALSANWMSGWMSLAYCYFYTDQYELAIETFTLTLEKMGDKPAEAVLYGRGLSYLWLACYKDAIADFDRYLALNDEDPFVFHQRGYAYAELNQITAAIADVEHAALTLNFDYSKDYLASLYELIPSKYSEQIVPLYQEAIKKEESSFAMLRLGCIYMYGSLETPVDYAEALSLFSEANAKEGGRYACALAHIGYAYECGAGVISDEKLAFSYYEKALEYEGHCACPRAYVAHSYFKGIGVEKDVDHAVELVLQSQLDGKFHSQLTYLHAYFLVQGINMKQDIKSAQKLLQNMLLEDPADVLAAYYLLALCEDKESKVAKKYSGILKKNHDFAEIETIRAIDVALRSGSYPFIYPFC